MDKIPKNGTETALKEAADDLQAVLDTSLCGLLVLADDGTVLFANKAAGDLLGTEHQEMAGRPFDDFILASEREMFGGLRRRAIDGPAGEMHIEVVERPHRQQWIEICYRRSGGADRPIYCSIRDVSARARVERELRERNAFLNGLIESSPDGIIAADMKGNIILFNRSAQELLGYTEREAIASLHALGLYVEGTARAILHKMRSDGYGGKGKCFKHRVISLTKDGREIPVSLSGGIIYDKDGNETATFGTFTDLRERERMERQLQGKQLELVHSEKMAAVGKLAAGVAHEINNPLSGVLIFASMILEEIAQDSPHRADLERIVSETTRCKTIVRELLDFARQDESTSDTTDINRIIREGIGLIRNQAIFHNVNVVFDLAPDLPPAIASASRLNQVLLNLVINAAEAMDGSGTLTIASRYVPETQKVRVTVSDTGCGITPDNRMRIFDPFFTTKEVGKGTGLGLSVSYRILQDCGATIDCQSAPGEGTTFIIDFVAPLLGAATEQTEAK